MSHKREMEIEVVDLELLCFYFILFYFIFFVVEILQILEVVLKN